MQARKRASCPCKLALPELVAAALSQSILGKRGGRQAAGRRRPALQAIQVDNFAPGELEGLSLNRPRRCTPPEFESSLQNRPMWPVFCCLTRHLQGRLIPV